jgi:hypothetical protein
MHTLPALQKADCAELSCTVPFLHTTCTYTHVPMLTVNHQQMWLVSMITQTTYVAGMEEEATLQIQLLVQRLDQ